MKVKRLGDTSTEIELRDGTYILVSYETPVAMYCSVESKFLKTDQFWSVTTSKHINQWLNGAKAEKIEQQELDAIFNSI